VSQTATSAAEPRMTATTSRACRPTLGIDTKSCFFGGTCGPRTRSDLERPLSFEAKSRPGDSGVQSVRWAAELKSVLLRPAPARRRLQDPYAHSRLRGAGNVCGLPTGATGLCRPRSSRVNPALRPNPSLNRRPTPAGSVSLARGTRVFSRSRLTPPASVVGVSSNVRLHKHTPPKVYAHQRS
jgi:hypothetical protein